MKVKKECFSKITSDERNLLEKAIFGRWTYSRKRSAYVARSKSTHSHTKEEWKEMHEFFNNVCCKCYGEVIGGIPTKDHIVPIYLGGTDHIRNIQPLCRQCNTSKNGIYDYRVSYCIEFGLEFPEKWRLTNV